MFDIAPSELLIVAIVALLVIGPKDLPLALRTAGRWLGKARQMSNHFRSGVETMIREAELAEIEKEWRERNARIMAEHPDAEALDRAQAEVMAPRDQPPQSASEQPSAVCAEPVHPASAEASALTGQPEPEAGEPELPLAPPARQSH